MAQLKSRQKVLTEIMWRDLKRAVNKQMPKNGSNIRPKLLYNNMKLTKNNSFRWTKVNL